MENELMNIKNEAMSLILDTDSHRDLEEIKLQFLGRSGKLTQAIKNIAKIPVEKRPEYGFLANEVKKQLEETLEQKLGTLGKHAAQHREEIDTTAPGIVPAIGHLHPMTLVLNEVVDVFKGLGFQAADGPEIETDTYNFEVLNIPKD